MLSGAKISAEREVGVVDEQMMKSREADPPEPDDAPCPLDVED